MSNKLPRLTEMDRRQFVTATAATLLGTRACSAEPTSADDKNRPSAKSVIYLYMDGGMSQLDTFDVKPGSKVQGPVEAIDTKVPTLKVSHHFRRLARLMDKIVVVRSMHTTQGAHREARYFLRTSYTIDASQRHPAIGSWIVHSTGRRNPSLPGNIAINPGSNYPYAGFLDSSHAALAICNPSEGLPNGRRRASMSQQTFDRQYALSQTLRSRFESRFPTKSVTSYTKLYDEAVRLMKCKDVEAFDIVREPQSLRDRYGDSCFGQGCLLARRLVEQGVRFVEVVKPGWDTHNYNFTQLDGLAADLDQSLSALLVDLSDRGLFESTLVVVATEFGRSPEISETMGRGHHVPAFTFLLAGGGTAGGQVHGATDSNSHEVARDPVTIPDMNATIAHAMGVSHDAKHYDETRQRDYRLADNGRPVPGLFR